MVTVYIFLLGLCFGSFALALVDRLHAKENWVSDRSKCEYCGHVLGIADLVPVASWLIQRGRCRYCRHKLTWQYPAVELLTGVLFALSYIYWDFEPGGSAAWLLLILWLAVVVLFVALTVYDLRWMLLPNRPVFVVLCISLAYSLLAAATGGNFIHDFAMALAAVAVGGGLFYVLFQLSDGKWIGGGDVKLGFGLGLLCGTPALAGMMLFIASLAGSLVGIPLLMVSGKKKRHLPFGPFLMLATVIVVLFGADIASWYSSHFLRF